MSYNMQKNKQYDYVNKSSNPSKDDLCDYFHGRFTMFIFIDGGILYILYSQYAAGKYSVRL